MLKIKNKFGSDLNSFNFQHIRTSEVKELLKEILFLRYTIIKNQLVSYFVKYLSPFISAYRENYRTKQVLIRLLEEWREKLDKNFIVAAVLMDLSKAFDCISHDLIIAKLAVYGIERQTVRLIYSYLKGRKQCVKRNSTYSDYNKMCTTRCYTRFYFVQTFHQ